MSTTTSWGSLGHSYNYQLHPFTAAQWKELERQAMIYKYIVASVPVPPDLLFSVSEHPSYAYAPSYASWGKLGGILNLRWGNLRDGEPGRCKRTDGKKWRCSRDVAPNQKYCERHLHRGRPRSRKPVEVRADFPINFNPGNNHHHQHCPKNAAKKTRLGGGVEVGEALSQHNQDSSHFNPKFDMNAVVASSQCMEPPVQAFKIGDTGDLCYKPIMPTTPYGKNRSLHWGIKGEENPMAATSGCQYWQPMGQTDMTLTIDGSPSNTSPCILGQNSGHDGPLNLNFSADFYPVNNNPKSFIDAFSDAVSVKNDISGERSKCPVSSMIRSSPYSLALSMGGCNDDHCPNSCEIQMGLAVPVSEFHSRDGPGQRSQTSSWLNSGLSWASSTPTLGGPLAEVLLPRVVASDPSCSDPGDRDLTAPPATTVSSPSGVLQRTLVSFSDSSGSNSPTWDSRKTKLGTPFHWLS